MKTIVVLFVCLFGFSGIAADVVVLPGSSILINPEDGIVQVSCEGTAQPVSNRCTVKNLPFDENRQGVFNQDGSMIGESIKGDLAAAVNRLKWYRGQGVCD